MDNKGMLAAVALAAGLDESTKVEVTSAFLKQHFSAVAAELVNEGKTAERERIIGIEKAAMPGHAAIIAAHKADPTKTPADAALAVISAENAIRGKQLSNLDKDEETVKNLRSETANDPALAKAPGAGLEGEAKWKAEYAASADLQAEFRTESKYLAWKKAEAAGTAKIFTPNKAA